MLVPSRARAAAFALAPSFLSRTPQSLAVARAPAGHAFALVLPSRRPVLIARPRPVTHTPTIAMTSAAGTAPVFAQTMLRVKDPKKSRAFYEDLLGMRHLTTLHFEDLKFSLDFYAYTDEQGPDMSIPQPERAKWLWSRPYPTVELTHNWGTETDEKFAYHNSNTEPKGFGHIGIIVDDIYKACENLEAKGVKIVRKPGPFTDAAEIAFAADPDGYWVEIIKRGKLTGVGSEAAAHEKVSRGVIGPDPVFAQVMLRVKDPKKSLEFYQHLGMKYVTRLDFDQYNFSLFFLAYTNDEPHVDLGEPQVERANWLWTRRYKTVELTHNHGTENQPEFAYHNGNVEPRGFGHIGIIVDDIYATCAKLEELGYKIVRKPGPFKDAAEIAFVADPDGYWVEIIKRDGQPQPLPYVKP